MIYLKASPTSQHMQKMFFLYVVMFFLYEWQLDLLPQVPDRPYNLDHSDPSGPAAPAQEAVPDPFQDALPPDEAVPVGEYIRRLAIRLLTYPDSQGDMFLIGQGAPGRVRISISFETATGNVLFPN
jgi:hypothetical protein